VKQIWDRRLFSAVAGNPEAVRPDNWRWVEGKKNIVRRFHRSSFYIGRKALLDGHPSVCPIFLSPSSKCELACLLPSYRSRRLVIHSLSGLRESGLSLSWRVQLSQEMCESLNPNSHGGAFPIWIRHVTAAPIGVIVVSGLPQEMDHQRASMPALTNSMAHSCDFSGCRRSEGLYSENGQCCGIRHEIVGVNVL